MKNTTTILCCFLCLLYSEDFKKFSIDNISSNRVLSATQDSSGFVWIGTDEGLNRYDGHTNKVYRSNIFDDKTISGNRVWITYTDQDNTLWVGTDRGVCYYNEEKDNFYRIETGSRPIHVLEHQENIFFTTTNNGVFKISRISKEVSKFQFDPLDPFSLSSSKFSEKQSTPLAIEGETLWTGTTNGLNKTNLNTGQTKRLYSGKTKLVKADTITSVLVVNDVLFVGSAKGLGMSDLVFGESLTIDAEKVTNSYIINMFELKGTDLVGVILKNEIIILKGGRAVQTIKTEKRLDKATNLNTGQYLITSINHKTGLFLTSTGTKDIVYEKTTTPIKARSILVDHEHGVWMGGDEGIVRAGNTKSPVTPHSRIKTQKGMFSKSGTDLFIATENKVFSYNERKEQTTVIQNTGKRNNQNKKLYVSEKKDVYLYGKQIEKLTKSGSITKLVTFKTPINAVVAGEASLFISLKNSGIAHYGLTTNNTTDYRKNRLLSKLIPAGASSFFLDKQTLWIGSDESGLYELDISEPESPKLIKHHTYIKNNPKSFSSSSVSCLAKHSELLFVGTNGDGLFLYDKGGFDKISIEHGMPSNNIVSLARSSDSTIWALTNGGLALVDWKNRNVSAVGAEEGLEKFYRSQDALIPKTDGNVYIVSPGGLQDVDARQLYTNEHEAVVVVESVELIDKNNKKHTTRKDNIRSTHTTPIIKINLTAPSIFKASNTTFSYFIDGYHDAWVDNGTRRYIEVQGLSPGTYTLKSKSYNSDGYESKNTASIKFSIIPPWWETWWAYTSYAVAVFMLFAFYVKYQKRAQAKATEDKRKEEELEEARQFQLDMLPRDTPDELGLDISSAIQTATEVGGDYYDYFPQKDGKSLYVVVGDATGHGMTAGMMVSITKAGLYGIPSIPPNDIARRLNRVIKNIDLGWNRMAFNMARFWEDRVEFTSAAMPPVYHYHGETGELDEVLLGGLPLGSIKDETFSLEEFDFNQGDSLIFISDGLPEAANHTGEMLGYDAVYNCIKANGNQSAEEQKQSLLDLGSAWLGGLQNQDDITIVVVKKSKPLE